MCFGSCQLPGLADQMMDAADDKGSLSNASASPAGVLYCLLPETQQEPRLNFSSLALPTSPLTEPHLVPRDHVGAVFEPPVLG